MWFFDFLSSIGRQIDATITFDARRNHWQVLLSSNKAVHFETLEIEFYKQNDYEDWLLDFLDTIEYQNEDDDSSTEYKKIKVDLTPGLPINIDFSLETFKHFTKENIEKYYEQQKANEVLEDDDIEDFTLAFLDPKWTLKLKADDTILGSIEFEYQNEEIAEYMHSIKK